MTEAPQSRIVTIRFPFGCRACGRVIKAGSLAQRVEREGRKPTFFHATCRVTS